MSLDLDAIRTRVHAATDGPWTTSDGGVDVYTAGGRTLVRLAEVLLGDDDTREHHPQATADAGFIANAPGDIRALLAEVERLQAENAALRAALGAVV